ncbi:MAG TPA: efflux RND transporter periplasmic adaptor subunit [Terriglobales bacterium]|nr:efflux RND transporter periplasmic adaptor subunit [Terriglobales bacterium]
MVVGVLVLAGLAAAYVPRNREPSAAPAVASPAARALQAEAYHVVPTTVRDSVRTTGTLAANESVVIVAELSRRLVKVAVAEGSTVARGDLLFKLDDADLRAELARLEVRRQLAERTVQRQRDLLSYEKRALSKQAYDQARTELQSVEAEIAALEVTLARTEIRAPFAARVGLRRVSEGAWITPETPLTTLQDTSQIKIDFTLPERYAGSVAVGQTFFFTVTGRGEQYQGRVLAVGTAIDANTRSMQVRGITGNAEGALMPGAFASVELVLQQSGEGMMVPAQAIVPAATGHSVFVLRDGRAHNREVKIGLRTRDQVEIIDGLAFGDVVLTTNLLRLREGIPVEVTAGTAG